MAAATERTRKRKRTAPCADRAVNDIRSIITHLHCAKYISRRRAAVAQVVRDGADSIAEVHSLIKIMGPATAKFIGREKDLGTIEVDKRGQPNAGKPIVRGS